MTSRKTHCLRGHPRVPENLDGRVCKACSLMFDRWRYWQREAKPGPKRDQRLAELNAEIERVVVPYKGSRQPKLQPRPRHHDPLLEALHRASRMKNPPQAR